MSDILIWHITRGLHRLDEMYKDKLLASGEWFLSPKDMEKKYEEPIRRSPKQRRKHGEVKTESHGS